MEDDMTDKNPQTVEVLIQRTVSVPPPLVTEFMKVSLEAAELSKKVMGVETDLFLKRGGHWKNAQFVLHTIFPSIALYERVFLCGLLYDDTYLRLAASAVKLITDEPLDELYVRLHPSDHFMNLDKKKREVFAFENAPERDVKPAFRIEREYCATKGRLREVMEINFGYMDRLYRKTNKAPKYFCTRFAASRIGCSKMYIDLDPGDPPPFDAFMAQDQLITRNHEDLLLTPPIETIMTRITPGHLDAQIL
jgi:hypothetical protein